jgi:hypothetical protein
VGPISDTQRQRVAIALILLAVIVVGYWITWAVARSAVAVERRPAYVEFEQAFPLADGLVTACLLAGAEALWRRRTTALLWFLVGGGAGAFLGCMDLLYDVEHGLWGKGSNGLTELCIVVVTFIAATSLVGWAWYHRAELGGLG